MAQDAIGSIPRQRYFDTQLLFAADFDREQQYGSAFRQLQTRLLFTPGVLSGLGVAGAAAGQVQVAPGTAVDDAGRTVLLVDRATVDGAAVAASGGGFTLDLSAAKYQGKTWLLTLHFAEQQDASGAFYTQVPALALAEAAAPAAGQVVLGRIAVSTAAASPGSTPAPAVTVDPSVRTYVALAPARVPRLDASSIAAGTLDPARIPPLPASAVGSGTFEAARIPPLDASSVATGTLAVERIPPLPATAIASGTLDAARIPSLDASAIATGTLAVERIPDLPASKVIGGGTGGGPAAWARDLAFWPRGAALGCRALGGSSATFFVGLVRTDTNQNRSYYAVGIGFGGPLLSFDAPQIRSAGVRVGVYADTTAYSLAREGGQPGEVATSVRFVGVPAKRAYNLLSPAADVPREVAGLVVVGTRAADPAADPPVGPVAIVQALRALVSPFSFSAVPAPSGPPMPSQAALAQALRAEGWIAPDAAPAVAAVQPIAPAALLSLLAGVFPESTATVAQGAWALAAAGADPAGASAALGQVFAGRASLADMGVALAGAFPSPSVQQAVARLQVAGTTAQAAAPQLKGTAPQLAAEPLAMGVLLRLGFPDSANTPLLVAQALRAAGFTAGAAATAALGQLFPTTAPGDVSAALQQAFGSAG